MTQQMAVFLGRRTMIAGLMVVGPLLGAGLIVGLLVAIFQALTSIRDMTLSMIPRILTVALVLLWLLPWMLKSILAYTANTLQCMSGLGM